MTNNQFNLLIYAKDNDLDSQRSLAKHMDVSLGTANSVIRECKELEYLDDNLNITKKGIDALKPYKVENAIIMAAGTSSRFAPLSYEKPKGLLKVKGDILIEREIRQLQEAGINDITVVVGYMKEKFFYLEDKFGVKLVVNEDYYRYNNTSTLIRVLDRIGNTYICSSDDYFVDNVFEQYVYKAYYAAVMIKGKSDEFGLITSKKGLIEKINHHPEDMYCMLGHVYFDKDFSKKFCEILKYDYEKVEETKYQLWEYLYERHIKELEMYIRIYDEDKVKEFDSLDELRAFDDKYLENTGSDIFKNICETLNCKESDITDIEVISQGLTNLSFSFVVNDIKYIYRHPGVGTESYISRKAEAFAMEKAKELNLDKTIIYISPDKGWKLSYFVNDAHTMDYHNEKEVKQALSMMNKLHNAKIHSEYDFGIWNETLKFIDKIEKERKDFNDFDELFSNMKKLYELTEKDGFEKVLCHCDCYDPNFLVDKNGDMTLIDWEYSGNDDPGCDMGTFVCCSDYTFDEALHVLDLYYGRKPTDKELRHMLAYISLASYYWFVWAIYQESLGKLVGEYLLLWYENTKIYMKKAIKLYEGENDG